MLEHEWWAVDDGRRTTNHPERSESEATKSNNGLYRPSYSCQVIHAQHARVPPRSFPSRSTSATCTFPERPSVRLLTLYSDATTCSGRTHRYLHSPDWCGADTFEARRSSTALRHNPVDRHVPERTSASSAAAPRTTLPPQHLRIRSNFGHCARRRFWLRLRLRRWLCRGPY